MGFLAGVILLISVMSSITTIFSGFAAVGGMARRLSGAEVGGLVAQGAAWGVMVGLGVGILIVAITGVDL